jgi:hypothetical protein
VVRNSIRVIFVAGIASLALAAPSVAAPLTWSAPNRLDPFASPFGASSSGAACQNAPAQTGTNFPGTQVEPWLAVDPGNPANQIAVWQQDRWSNGGANALLSAYTTNAGLTWITPPISDQPKFSYCTGGSGDSGGYTRNSDPWVTVSPNGDDWFMALQADIGTASGNNAMSVARSTTHGATWEAPVVLKRDTSPNVLNDKNSITADRFDSTYVYAIWDRLEFPSAIAARQAGEHAIGYRGPTWFARHTSTGWGPAHIIYDPGEVNQTIGNQIVQTGTGRLVDGFNLIFNFKNAHKVRGYNIAVLRSDNRGATWSGAKIVSKLVPGTIHDPTTGAPVRTGDIIPEIAADPRPGSNTVYLVWQDRTLGTGGSAIAFSKSTDGGVTWSTPVAINKRTDVEAFTPAISVAPDGTIGVTYYDFRNDTAAAPLVTDTWSVHSHDGGATWTEDHVSGPFDMTTAPIARGYFTGDYEGLGAGADPNPFFESAVVQADGTTANRASHTYTSRGQ